jgi:MFS family permease
MQLTVLTMIASCVGLVYLRNGILIVACQVFVGVGTIALPVVFTKLLHDSLPSRVRAGASSAVGSLTRIVMIPLSLLFGFISRESGVFRASWLFLLLLVVVFYLASKLFAGRRELEPVTATDPGVRDVQK